MTTAFRTLEERPPRTAVVLVVLPAIVAVTATIPVLLGMAGSAVGAVVLVAGVRFGSRRLVTVGALGLFGGVLFAAVREVAVLQVTVGAAATVIAWDAGTNAIGVGRQLGSRAQTRDVLVAHTVGTTLVALLVGVGTIVVFRVTRGGEPTTAMALLVVAALLFVWLLDR